MSDHSRDAGFSLVSLVLAMLICLALVMIYLREAGTIDSQGGAPGGALNAARSQARNFEKQQQKRLDEMRKLAPE